MNQTTITSAPVAIARSFLFVPANRPERLAKALSSSADAVVLDLEDSVPPQDKARAREAVARQWATVSSQSQSIVIRINPPQSEAGVADLAWLVKLKPCPVIMVAKADSASTLEQVHAICPGAPLLPLIESAQGYARLAEIAAAANVVRLVVGHIDFMVDIGIRCSSDQRELEALRFAVAIQTRLNNLAAAVDGVTVDVDDQELLRTDSLRALSFGFGAKLCIHPRQVETVHAAFAPSEAEVHWARRVLEGNRTAGGAAFKLDGRMVDVPVVLQAQRTLDRVRA